MIDLTQQRPPFANACWADDKTMCQWCGGTGHVAGDPNGELCKCPDLVAQKVCECGEPECLGDAKWFAEATADIAMQLAEQVPGLDSPLLQAGEGAQRGARSGQADVRRGQRRFGRRGILHGDAGSSPGDHRLEGRCQVSRVITKNMLLNRPDVRKDSGTKDTAFRGRRKAKRVRMRKLQRDSRRVQQ
jgi:hypothetical protein